MGMIKDFIARANERKRKASEYEDNDRVVNSIEQKKLSHNERELIKSLEEEKQKCLKEALYWDNRKRQLEDKKMAIDMMKFDNSLFNNRNILAEKNAFLNGGDF